MRRVTIVEVSPRDGLQNESVLLDTEDKVHLIEGAVAAGIPRVEVTSFVHPDRVPQMADAEAVVAALAPNAAASYIGLALNERGVHRALKAGVDEINFVVVTTDTFNERNQGVTTEQSIAALASLVDEVKATETRVGVTIAAAFGCPFEGEVPVARFVQVAERIAALAPHEISLADTIGVGAPNDVAERVGAVREVAGTIPLRCHFHNTRNTGLANAYAAVEAGVEALDASLGGIGGCPFAPAATGNVPTEDLVYMLDRMGVETGIDLDALLEHSAWLQHRIGSPHPGLLLRAGRFPPVH